MGSSRDPELFREVFGRFATGVAVVTSSGPGGTGGMTANALCSLSLEPLLALVCFENGVFASKLPEAEKLHGVAHRFEHDVPIIDGALAWATCALRELIAGGDHTIAIGEVLSMGLGEGEPLLWYGGRYHAGSLA